MRHVLSTDTRARSRFYPRLLSTLPVLVLPCSAWTATPEGFETPPDEEPSASLTASQVSGESFHIAAPVHSDGLMHHYVVDSRFGVFPAYGRDALVVRLREVAALTKIAKTSDVEVALKSVGRGLKDNASAAVELAKNPVGTVLGIPKGIGHLFTGYRAQAQEVSKEVSKEVSHQTSHSSDAQSPSRSVTHEMTTDAKRYAARYFGLSAAEMRWYRQLDVDPYTDNELLRSAVKHLAKVDATTSLGMRFAPMPGIPYAGEVRRALNAIYNEDPAVLRKRRRETLAGYGLTPEEIDRFENTLLLNPTRQVLLVDAAKSLEGVEGRAELFRHALSVTSTEEIEVFLQSTSLLVHYHAKEPVARIVAGLRVPTAQVADGRVIVFGAFDAGYWTEDTAGYAQSVERALPPNASGREFVLSGSVSARARGELERRGWKIHDRATTVSTH